MINSTKKTILITGGAGFLGSHLCRKYLTEKNKIICLDNLQTTGSTYNIEKLRSNPNFSFIKHDIINPLPEIGKVDLIFNFACSGSYTSYQFNPVHTIRTNTEGVINILEKAYIDKACVMQASTSEIYGNPLESPQKETYFGNVNPLGPRACYDEGKRVAETLFMDYHKEYGVDIKIIRIFNTYGPYMSYNDGRAISNFISAALSNRDITIYGDGSVTRSFQYVDDLISGIDKMIATNIVGPINLGNPKEITIHDLVEKIIIMTKSKSKIVYDKPATDDPQRRCPDISLAKEKLNWQPYVNIDDGLQKTIEYFKVSKEHKDLFVNKLSRPK